MFFDGERKHPPEIHHRLVVLPIDSTENGDSTDTIWFSLVPVEQIQYWIAIHQSPGRHFSAGFPSSRIQGITALSLCLKRAIGWRRCLMNCDFHLNFSGLRRWLRRNFPQSLSDPSSIQRYSRSLLRNSLEILISRVSRHGFFWNLFPKIYTPHMKDSLGLCAVLARVSRTFESFFLPFRLQDYARCHCGHHKHY